MDLPRETLHHLAHAATGPANPQQLGGAIGSPNPIESACQWELCQGQWMRGIERHPGRPAIPEPVWPEMGIVVDGHRAIYPTMQTYNDGMTEGPSRRTGDTVSIEGTVVEALPHAMFAIALDSGQRILGHIAGTLTTRALRINPGDRVLVELS